MTTLFSGIRGYSSDALKAELTAGLIVAVISIPLGLAFAIASGATPIQGLITAVVAGSVVAVFGGSRFQIAGAAAALIPILAGIALKSTCTRANDQVKGMPEDFQEDGLLDSDAIVTNTDQAIRSAIRYMKPDICASCTGWVFAQCAQQPESAKSAPMQAFSNPFNQGAPAP